MINKIKDVIKGNRHKFNEICRSNNLSLAYENNKTEIEILKDIFCNREYSDYFPFYKNNTIVDIGAHYGYFCIFANNNSDVDSRIIAIEPNNQNFNHLKQNISDSKASNVSIHNFAVGANCGVAKLYQGQNPNHSIINNFKLTNEKENY